METDITILELKNETQSWEELKKINCDEMGLHILCPKSVFKVIKIKKIRTKAANILKQTFLGKGGDVAVSRATADLSEEHTDVIIFATLKQYKVALAQLKVQPWGLAKLAQEIENILMKSKGGPYRNYQWSDRALEINDTNSLVMGILNITPDSFSDGGKFNQKETAKARVIALQEAGADIIDIGAESTRPYGGAEKVTEKEELERLLPILEYIIPYCKVPISIDTYKANVAEAALDCGAHMINDIWGLQQDEKMAQVAAKYDVPVVVMHNHVDMQYPEGIMCHMRSFFEKSIAIGLENGLKRENIIIDPGIGFAKNFNQNMYVMNHLEELQLMDCPILLATSRKRFIGEVLDLPIEERVEGTIATAALGKQKGVQIHRVHDVKEVKRTLKMLDAMMRRGRDE